MDNMSILEQAREFAVRWHGTQLYANMPYAVHLMMTEQVYRQYHTAFDSKGARYDLCLYAIWLHDILEDTQCPRYLLEETFGTELTDIVWRVTDEPGKNRKERHEKTYPKTAGNINSIIVKLCDRLANVQFCFQNADTNRLKMYAKEHKDFYEVLGLPRHKADTMSYTEGKLWTELDLILVGYS